MSSRTEILDSIKNALADVKSSQTQTQEAPKTPEIWSIKGTPTSELANIFAENLQAVAGRAFLCPDETSAVAQIREQLEQVAAASGKETPYLLGVYDSELAQTIAASALADAPSWKMMNAPTDPKVDPKTYEPMTASLISPIVLLSDTGSCAVEGRSAFERLLFYLSPACFVVALESQLREHLPHAWKEIETIMRRPDQPGEIALITGPSRTADIEKKLVLGVHGPQKLYVFIIKGK